MKNLYLAVTLLALAGCQFEITTDAEIPTIPVEVVVPPTDPTEPTEPTDPVDPVDPVEPPAPTPTPVPPATNTIDELPPLDYSGAFVHQDFNHRQVGPYTEDELDTDLVLRWQTLNGPAAIVDVAGDKKFSISAIAGQIKKGLWSAKDLNELEEVYFSYQVTFTGNYDFKLGGKLPGVAGLNFDLKDINGNQFNPDGCKKVTANQGFSLRSMFRENGRAVGYFYHQNNPRMSSDNCGEQVQYVHNGEDFHFKRDTAYVVEQYVKMNTANNADGIVRIYVNGHKVLDRDNMVFGQDRLYAINHLYFYLWQHQQLGTVKGVHCLSR
jgi:hypothetical protein